MVCWLVHSCSAICQVFVWEYPDTVWQAWDWKEHLLSSTRDACRLESVVHRWHYSHWLARKHTCSAREQWWQCAVCLDDSLQHRNQHKEVDSHHVLVQHKVLFTCALVYWTHIEASCNKEVCTSYWCQLQHKVLIEAPLWTAQDLQRVLQQKTWREDQLAGCKHLTSQS